MSAHRIAELEVFDQVKNLILSKGNELDAEIGGQINIPIKSDAKAKFRTSEDRNFANDRILQTCLATAKSNQASFVRKRDLERARQSVIGSFKKTQEVLQPNRLS